MTTSAPTKAAPRSNRKNRLNEVFIKNLKPTERRVVYTDEICQGLSLRVGVTGTKTFAFMGRDCKGSNQTITLGRYPDVSLKMARNKADSARRFLQDPQQLAEFRKAAPVREETTLLELLLEAEAQFGKKERKKIWLPRGKRSDVSTARQVISCVFLSLMNKPLEQSDLEQFALCAGTYKPKSGKPSANGQAAKALAYLRPAFDWASHRGKRFEKIGAGRIPQLDLPDLARVHDPSTNDPLIKGKRDRVLLPDEIFRIMSELQIGEEGSAGWRDVDLRPVAHRFILKTLARRSEVENTRWKDLDFELKTWTRYVKSTNPPREVTHPLSDAAIDLLRSLPGYSHRQPDDYAFPNRHGGPLDNWSRSTEEIQDASETSNWTRHDLRRTAATIMEKMGVAAPLIDTLLSHKNSFSQQNTSKAAAAYIQIGQQMQGLPEPLRDAVNVLAKVLQAIEDGTLT